MGTAVCFYPIRVILDCAVGDRGIGTLTVDAIDSVLNDTAVDQTTGIISIITEPDAVPACGIKRRECDPGSCERAFVTAATLMANKQINAAIEFYCGTTGDLQRGKLGTVIAAPDIKVARDQVRGTGIGPYIGQIFI